MAFAYPQEPKRSIYDSGDWTTGWIESFEKWKKNNDKNPLFRNVSDKFLKDRWAFEVMGETLENRNMRYDLANELFLKADEAEKGMAFSNRELSKIHCDQAVIMRALSIILKQDQLYQTKK